MTNRILIVLSICSCIVACVSFVLAAVETPPFLTGRAARNLSKDSFLISLFLWGAVLSISSRTGATKPPRWAEVVGALVLGLTAVVWVVVTVAWVFWASGYGIPALGQHSIFHVRDEYYFENHSKKIVTDRDKFISIVLVDFASDLISIFLMTMISIFVSRYGCLPFGGPPDTESTVNEPASQTCSPGG